jgi:uncharacterized protein with ParB-like and HNH nuclease domain
VSYKSETLSDVLSKLNTQYFLPAIQREFVWQPEQIVALLDSVLRGYPIGSCLFWELKEDNQNRWTCYRFIDNAQQGGTHNTIAQMDGVPKPVLVLDGQQRLTALLIGLKGTYKVKRKYKRKNAADAWSTQRLFLNLFDDPDEVDEARQQEVYYGLHFLEGDPTDDKDHAWFKLGRILEFDSEDQFYKFRQQIRAKLPGDATLKSAEVAERNLDRLYRAVWKDEAINFYSERVQSYDRVLDIFVRANQGGTKLTKSDLLLSTVTLKWDGVDAREAIYAFVDRLNSELTRKNNFDKDFVMKACLALTDLPLKYEVESFTPANLKKIEQQWDAIKSAIERGVDLVNTFGIDKENLTSANALIPVIYFLYQRPKLTLRDNSAFSARNAGAVRRWLVSALLNNVFSGASDTMLQAIRDVLQKHPGKDVDFPIVPLGDAISARGRFASVTSADALDNYLSTEYRDKTAFLALSILFDEAGWGTMTYHQDHIFPNDMFKPRNLQKAGITGDQAEEFAASKNRLGNLTLLVASENIEKSNIPFDQWLPTRDKAFKAKHLIPDDPSLYSIARFDEFLLAREDLIKARLKMLFAAPTAVAQH